MAVLQAHAHEDERGAHEDDEQRGARERDRQRLVDIAHDRALGPDDLDRRRRNDGRVAGAGEVGRRVADLRGRGVGRRRGARVRECRRGAHRDEGPDGDEPDGEPAESADELAVGLHGDLLWMG
jgi:hypothetical protein